MSTRDAGATTQIMVIDIKITQIFIPVSYGHGPAHTPGSAGAFADLMTAFERCPKTARSICKNVPMTSMPGRPRIEKGLRRLSCMMDHHMPMATFTSAMR
jgi:hypothetical protein